MAESFACPYFGGSVELTDEREEHIRSEHSDLPEAYLDLISSVLQSPDMIRQDRRASNTLVFSRWYDDLGRGKHGVVVVVTDETPSTRHWIVTAYVASRVPERDVIWRRS